MLKYQVIRLLLFYILSAAAVNCYSETTKLWKYSDYTRYWTTAGSDYIYDDGIVALKDLGAKHWNHVSSDYTFYFLDLIGASCNAQGTECSAKPRYEQCHILSGMSPATRNLWQYSDCYNINRSDFIYNNAESALRALGNVFWNKIMGDSAYYFIDIFDFTCDASNTKCHARPQYERCYLESGMTPETRNLWRYNQYDYWFRGTSRSEFTYTDGISALEALGKKHWTRIADGDSYKFLSLYDVSCNNDNTQCMARSTVERCDLESGACSTSTPLNYMYSVRGACSIVTPLNHMYASRGACSIHTPVSYMYSYSNNLVCPEGQRWNIETKSCSVAFDVDKNLGAECEDGVGANGPSPFAGYEGL